MENAPTFTLIDTEDEKVTLPKKGTVVLYFYPKANTPGCTIEAKEFKELYPKFIEAGAMVWGVSPDPLSAVCDFRDKYSFPFTMLADPEHKVAEKYGVWKKRSFMGKSYMGIERTTFLIADGKIVKQWKHKPGKTEKDVLAAIT